MDSYRDFLDYFKIDKQSLFDWGISATVFPDPSKVALEWENLKKRVFNNEVVYIREYGRKGLTDLLQDMYCTLFDNCNVMIDSSNNTAPTKHIQYLTGLKKNEDICNYQVAHIWGRTKNLFMFEAPWNICYAPKIMDPFTGHESTGEWPKEYQKMFIAKAYELYKPFIEDYNQLLVEYDIPARANEYVLTLVDEFSSEKDFTKFAERVREELSPVICNPF